MKMFKLPKRHRRLKIRRSELPAYIALTPMVLLSLLPILYIVFTAFKPIGELFAYPPKFITLNPTFDNFKKLLKTVKSFTA